MLIIQKFLVGLIAVQHIGFLILEMFFWDTPMGHKIFKLPAEIMKGSAGLAANQGLYNGFLAAGLIWSLLKLEPGLSIKLQKYFLSCVFIAGIFGGFTAKPSIFFVQALPAAITIVLTFIMSKKEI